MSINKPQHARLLFIDEKIRSSSYPNAASLSKEYEVSGRTITRDIEYMRDSLGAPIEYDKVKKGFYYSEANFFLPAIDIKESDFFAICITEKALKQYENTPLYDKLSSVFSKLKEHLPDSIRINTTWIDTKYTFMHESFTHIDPAIWETISNSLRLKKQLNISHRKAESAEAQSRIVEPYHIVNYRGEWYLIAMCRKRNEVVRFGMSRIKEATILKTPYEIPEDFEFNSFIGPSFGIMTEDHEHNVKIKFGPKIAPYVTERHWHNDQIITEEKDGSVILSFNTNSLFEVKRWILSWGAGAEALSPKELVDFIREDVREMSGVYL